MHQKDAKTILSPQNGMNLYRGCTHGCIYCDSRSDCYQMNHAFEDVEVKQNAPALLEEALRRKRKPCMIATGSMCDPYLPLERELRLTRRCLELIRRYGFGVAVQTKSDLVLRDLELLQSINRRTKAVVQMTLTIWDDRLSARIEPNVCNTRRRAEVLCRFRDAGIPTVVWLTPLLPFLTDTEENVRALLEACFSAGVYGVITFGAGVTLRRGDREYFYAQLDRHFPGMKERYIRAYGDAYECPSPNEARLTALIRRECLAHGVVCDTQEVFRWMHTFRDRGETEQLSLFENDENNA